MSETPVIPIKQANITIGGQSFVAVLLSNGEAGLVFLELCEWLGLQTGIQAHHLRRHPTLSAALILTLIQTPGGPQATNIIVAWGLPLWLARIQPDKRPPLYRERLLVLQRDARAALSQEFFKDPTEEPPPPKWEKPSTSLEKSPSVLEAIQTFRQGVQIFDQGLDLLQRAVAADQQAREDEIRVLKQEQEAMQARLRHLEGRLAPSRSVDPEEPVGSMPLTVAQYEKLVDLLRRLSRRSRVPYKALEMQLSDHCGTDRLSAISQAAWPEALAWVASRLGDY